jgi:hypothetical protein
MWPQHNSYHGGSSDKSRKSTAQRSKIASHVTTLAVNVLFSETPSGMNNHIRRLMIVRAHVTMLATMNMMTTTPIPSSKQ